MKLYKDILCTILKNEAVEVRFPDLSLSDDFFGAICYRTLKKIKTILEDKTLDDPECFEKIEEIIEIFEELGAKISGRHDFG